MVKQMKMENTIPGGPEKNGTVDTVDFSGFALNNSYLFFTLAG